MTTVKVINHKGDAAICIPNAMTGKKLQKFIKKNKAAIVSAKAEVIASNKMQGENRQEIEVSGQDDEGD